VASRRRRGGAEPLAALAAAALADALAALVATPGGVWLPVDAFRASVDGLAPAARVPVLSALRTAALAPTADAATALLAADLLDLSRDTAVTDALVGHLARLWAPFSAATQPDGLTGPEGPSFQPELQRLTTRLSAVRTEPVGRICCPVTRLRLNGRGADAQAGRAGDRQGASELQTSVGGSTDVCRWGVTSSAGATAAPTQRALTGA